MKVPKRIRQNISGFNWRYISIGLVSLVLLGILHSVIWPDIWPDWFGFGRGESKTVVEERDGKGKLVKTITTTNSDNSKTIWDWLSLLGVPLTLAILGYIFQTVQHRQAQEETKKQREIAADETKEEVLQVYFDRLSALLVDKNLIAIASKKAKADAESATPEDKNAITLQERELLDSSLDVVRARTLSILRRFDDDLVRTQSVFNFLVEADFFKKLNLSLAGADFRRHVFKEVNLSGADLSGADLSEANLYRAALGGAKLFATALGGAYLSEAYLRGADLMGANLREADLRGATLWEADLNGADLRGADLTCTKLNGADLREADLCEARLFGADLSEANLDLITWDPETTTWPTIYPFQDIKNIPQDLRTHLGLPKSKDEESP